MWGRKGKEYRKTIKMQAKSLRELIEENRKLEAKIEYMHPDTGTDMRLLGENTTLKSELRDLKAREETTIQKWIEETLRELEGVVNHRVGNLQHWLKVGQTESVYREREVIVVKKKQEE